MREIINEYLAKSCMEKDSVALLLSGGIDSCTMLFSLLDIGIVPHAYCFKLKSFDSNDFLTSSRICQTLHIPFTPIIIDDLISKEELLVQIEQIIIICKCGKTTTIQVVHPLLQVISQISEKTIVSGICADTLYGNTKKMAITNSKSKELFNAMRIKCHLDEKDSSYFYINKICEDYGKTLIAPYKKCDRLATLFFSKSYTQLMKPFKRLARENYHELEYYNLIRKPTNLQIGGGIKDWHNRVLLRGTNKKDVVSIYNTMYKRIENGTSLQLPLEFN